jgi:hypothetical protein
MAQSIFDNWFEEDNVFLTTHFPKLGNKFSAFSTSDAVAFHDNLCEVCR